MVENGNGRVRITIEVEVNAALMDTVKEGISKMSSSIPHMMQRGRKEAQEGQ